MVDESSHKESVPPVPPIVYAEASVHSVGEISLYETAEAVTSENVSDFYSEPQLVSSAVERLRTEGFEVLRIGQTTLTIAAPAEVHERVYTTRILAEEREAVKHYGQVTTATFLECPDTATPGLVDPAESPLADALEGVALNEPAYPLASASPPPRTYWHLEVPADVARGINADPAHQAGFTGRDVKVTYGGYRMVSSSLL